MWTEFIPIGPLLLTVYNEPEMGSITVIHYLKNQYINITITSKIYNYITITITI